LHIALSRSCLFLLALLGGCTTRSAGPDTLPDLATRRRHGALVTQIAGSGPEAELTYVTALDADSRGRMYVANMFQQSVTVLAPDGKVLWKIGRDGSGPGEFRSVRDVQVLPGDSLLVYDPELARVSVFAADSSRPAYVVNMADHLRGMPPFHLRRAPATGGYLAYFQARFAFGSDNRFEARRDSVALLNADGSTRARVASFAAAPFLVARTSVTPHPFGRRMVAGLDSRGRTLLAWTDSLAVTAYSPAGKREGSFSSRYDPPPITRDDSRRALERMGGEQGKRMFESVLADSLPARWPAMGDLLVDDRDRVWINLAGPLDQPAEWAVFSPAGRYLYSVFLPPGTTLQAVRAGRAYAVQVGDAGVPRVTVFEIRPRS
jgi:hypothetical protein